VNHFGRLPSFPVRGSQNSDSDREQEKCQPSNHGADNSAVLSGDAGVRAKVGWDESKSPARGTAIRSQTRLFLRCEARTSHEKVKEMLLIAQWALFSHTTATAIARFHSTL
jgi:hypothetical protein